MLTLTTPPSAALAKMMVEFVPPSIVLLCEGRGFAFEKSNLLCFGSAPARSRFDGRPRLAEAMAEECLNAIQGICVAPKAPKKKEANCGHCRADSSHFRELTEIFR